VSKSPGAGNPAWKASRAATRFKAGHLNFRRCNQLTIHGLPCRAVAVVGCDRCYDHGGAIVVRRRQHKTRKLKHAVWTTTYRERKQHEAERQQRIADEWHTPTGGD
jgi:hypothetical protein